jgi:hypothetical protein
MTKEIRNLCGANSREKNLGKQIMFILSCLRSSYFAMMEEWFLQPILQRGHLLLFIDRLRIKLNISQYPAPLHIFVIHNGLRVYMSCSWDFFSYMWVANCNRENIYIIEFVLETKIMLTRIKLSASCFLYIKLMHISVCTPSSPNWYTIFTPCLVHCQYWGWSNNATCQMCLSSLKTCTHWFMHCFKLLSTS